MVPAPLGGDETGPNPIDRAKSGSKRHLWVDQRGAPLSIQVTAANTHDATQIMPLLNRPIVRRPKTKYKVQHLCADKAYDSEKVRTKLRQRNITPHIRKREYDSDTTPPPLEAEKHPARRWVVERTFAWFVRYRRLVVDYEYHPETSEAMIQAAMIHRMLRCLHPKP